MKKCALLVLFLVWCLGGGVYALSVHYYLNGRVNAVSDNSITVDGRVFKIVPRARVAIQTERNGAFFEDPARISNISRGDSVNVRVTGNTVDDIQIERWKR